MMIKKSFLWLQDKLSSTKTTPILQAQRQLFYLMLGGNIIKGLVSFTDALYTHQPDYSFRSIRLMVVAAVMIVLLRRFPKLIQPGIHFAILGTIAHVFYRVFNQSAGTDIITLQYIFLVTMCGFYGLGKNWGAVYTVIATSALFLPQFISFRAHSLPPMSAAAYQIYVLINAVIILLSHWYFHRVLFGNLRERKQLNEELTAASRAKSNFLSTMSHELRTPLNAVIGIANLLIYDNPGARQKEQLDVLKFSAESLLTLINNILDINKLDSGKVELEHIPFNVFTLLDSIAGGMAFKAQEKGLRFSLKVAPELKQLEFMGDPTRLSQIIYNLAGNAVKFTEQGSVLLEAAVTGQQAGQYNILFTVQDTGIGITPEQQRFIFQPFTQASTDTTRKYGGTGLGLSIVTQLVDMFGGTLRVQSEPGQGTTFTAAISFTAIAKEKAAVPVVQPPADYGLSSLKILLAEDNMMNIYFMQQLFKRWNIVADYAENGEEVLGHLEEKAYDVILMDMHMPVMDGMEATRRIRQLPDPLKAGTCIIALTASVSENVQSRVKACGMDDYLHKPFQLDELKTKLLRQVTC